MTAEYTQGPIKLARHGAIIGGPVREYVNGSSQNQIFMCCVTQEGNGTQEGNARRLVACWNACIGITTEQLQSDHDQGYEPWGHVQHLTTGRDALLDAMQEISRMSVGTTVGRTADAAISKATGVKS